MGLFQSFNRAAYAIYEALNGPASSYCRLETNDDEYTLVADNGALVTVMAMDGSLSRISNMDYDRIVNNLTMKTQSMLSKPGHTVQMIFEYNPPATNEMVGLNFYPSVVTGRELGLDVEDILLDWQKQVATYCCAEKCWLVLWTDGSCLADSDRKRAYREVMENQKNDPLVYGCQKMSRGIGAIRHTHAGAVQGLIEAMTSVGILVKPVEVRTALRELRCCIDPHVTSQAWRPLLPGDKLPAGYPDDGGPDLYNFLYPSLKRQLFPREAEMIDRYKVRIGDQIHVPILMALPPQSPMPFNEFFKMLTRKKTQERIPLRMCITMKSDGLSLLGFKNLLAQVLSFTSSVNKRFVQAVDELRALSLKGYGIVQFSASFDTWVDLTMYKSENEAHHVLRQQMAELTNLVQAWGTCETQDVTGDPLLGAVACMPAMMPNGGPAPRAAAPLEAAWSFLPTRQASPWKQGPLAFRTPEGKLMPFAPNSSEQTAWIDLTVAPMGAGKSVLLNVFNFAFNLQAGLTRMPWISIVDVGPSSAGLISLLKAALPPSKQYLAEYYRLRMTPEYAVNPFDTPLGCRHPLPAHKSFLINFLCLLATPLGDAELPSGINGMAQQAITAAYLELDKTKPNPFSRALNEEVNHILDKEGYPFDEATTWWEVVDWLFDRGHIHEAYLAQRYAVPRIADVTSAIRNNEGIKAMYQYQAPSGEPIIEYFWRTILEAQDAYPILNLPTQFSLGDAQIVSLDLDEVAPKGGAAANRQSAVMYMLARQIVGSRFFLMPSDVVLMPEKYQAYHAKLIDEIRQDPKRLCYDEAHRMMSDGVAAQQIVQDLMTSARESRKWNLSIGLCSQSMQDFPPIIRELATVVHILGAGTEKNMALLQDEFGLNPTVMHMLKNIPKPSAKGSTMIQWAKTSQAVTQQALTLTVGPMMLWALSSTTEDRTLRDKLYTQTGSIRKTLEYLSKKFPGGVKAEVERRKIIKEETSMEDEKVDVLHQIFLEAFETINGTA